MGSSKAPKQPDPLPAAKATAEANKEVAQYTTALDRPTQSDPYGAITWEFTGAGGGTRDKPMPGDWVQKTTLSPQQQSLLNLENLAQTGAYGLGINALEAARAGGAGGQVDLSGLPTVRDIQTPDLTQAQIPQWAGLGGEFQADPQAFAAQGDQIRDALYQQMTQFSGERFAKEEDALRTRLANQGFSTGAEGFNTELSEFQRGKDESYKGAELAAILAGGQEQSRIFANLLAGRGQQLAESQFGYGTSMDAYQAEQARQQQEFANQYQLASWDQQLRNQQLQEQMVQRQTPLNEALSMAGMTGVTNPAFQPFNLSQPWQGVDYLGVQNQRYQGDVNQANFQNAQRSQNMQLLGGLGAAAATTMM